MESTVFYPRLCGGTFFTLLTHALKHGQRAHSFGSDCAEITQTNCLIGLLKVMDPGYLEGPRSTFDSNVTAYKQCELPANTYLPFDDEIKITAFDQKIKSGYSTALDEMAAYTDTFFENGAKGEWLVRALIELIQKDESIPGTDVFYVTPDGCATCKANITALPVVLFPAFLLGVWHYIVVNRKNNRVGAETFRHWHEFGKKGSRPKFTSNIGNNAELTITVLFNYYPETQSENRTASAAPTMGLTMDYAPYLAKLEEDYSSIKNLLYETPHPFRDFYVCNNVIRREVVLEGGRSHTKLDYVTDLNIRKLCEISNCCIIAGTGGIGKSMMMRHLLLDAIDAYKTTKKLPVFITLRDYSSAEQDIIDFVYEKLCQRIPEYPRDEFIRALGSGSVILLLDGLDEVNLSIRGVFETKLEQFTNTYRENLFVLSTRPYSRFQHLSRYNVLSICPFTKSQALELIKKLDYNEIVKDKFYKELDESLYNLHKDFTENPLLLTIMLMTYETFADIPSKIHQFYRLAYQTMAQKHDAVKDGVYKRVMRSNLTPERFEEYIAEFCALSYTEGHHKINEVQAAKYLQIVKEHIGTPAEQSLRISDFMDDLLNGLCLMYESEGAYHFTHRSFQEYFTALFMSKQMDSDLKAIGDFFEDNISPGGGDLRQDKTFTMLFDMITPKVERFIIRPYIEKLLEKCSPDSAIGYWTFLNEVYAEIGMEYGNVSEWAINDPQSFLYDFISRHYGFLHEDLDDNAPYDETFMRRCYVFGCDEHGHRGLVEINAFDLIGDDDDPEIEGWCLTIDPLRVYEHQSLHEELYELMNDEDFPFKKEYNGLLRLYEKLKTEQDRPRTSLMSLFGK